MLRVKALLWQGQLLGCLLGGLRAWIPIQQRLADLIQPYRCDQQPFIAQSVTGFATVCRRMLDFS